MELSDWCEQVPHGQYFQPIRLRVEGSTVHDAHDEPQSDPSAIAPDAAEPSPATTNKPTAAKETKASKRHARRPKGSKAPPQDRRTASDTDNDGIVLLPPFQSAHVGEDRMVLNVGGPVWAMDWLPHDVNRATATTGSRAKKAATTNGTKENVNRNIATTPAPSGLKDPLVDWRLLALSTHPPCKVVNDRLVKNTPPDHYYDKPQTGRGLIQIWAVPAKKLSTSKEGEDSGDAPVSTSRSMPRLVYAIDHDSGVAWDLHWSPLAHKMPRYRAAQSVLGVLAVAFGDGSLQLFEVPTIHPDKLQTVPNEHVVERLRPIASGSVDRNLQLSVRWSPHRWNLLISGCSDGSVVLWNVEQLFSKPPDDAARDSVVELEPQRRFQDADTIGKQEPFDWGWGWVAIRAICWSPLDENLFATTGNDSLFKLWDIREPRVCFRSHRIRSTWGLSMQWMDDTFIQISGDQGSLHSYDVLSGSHQKLHFHPQIDSPVWDLQFARRGGLPLLISSCTSGSLRLAAAKKLFRAPQHAIELCRLHGEKDASVEQPHKSLTLSFDQRLVNGTAEAASPATREFCERDASLHRVRLSTIVPGSYPCFMATAGHAGLVIIMEMQQQLDDVFEKFFMQPNKKIGRPKKVADEGGKKNSWGTQLSEEIPKKTGPLKGKRAAGSGKANLSSFVHGSGVARTKATAKKTMKKMKGGIEIVDEDDDDEDEASESEPEYQEDDEDDGSDTDSVSLGDDNSDDDRVVASEDEDESSDIDVISPEDPTTARMRQEYQLDLSEEDAMMLAIQMSEMEQSHPTASSSAAASKAKSEVKPSAKARKKISPAKSTPVSTAATLSSKSKIQSPPAPKKQKPNPTSSVKRGAPKASDQEAATPAASTPTELSSKKAKAASRPSAEKADSITKKVNGSATKEPITKPPKTPATSTAALYVDDMDQNSIQMHIYQQGMTEKDALRAALRMSEEGIMRRSNRKRKTPSSTESPSLDPVASPTPPKALKTTIAHRTPHATEASTNPASAASPNDIVRRLDFANGSPQLTPSATPVSKSITPPLAPKPRGRPPSGGKKTTPAAKSKTTPVKSTAAADPGATVGATTPEPGPRPTGKRPSGTASKSAKKPPAPSAKKAKTKRASAGASDLFLSEEELIAIALQTSQIEY